MKQADPIHQEVEELELKVERLKALYQQFFMGIEKIPPDVLKKEVDRSIWRLRREQLRGTRLLFKFQQIVQRYNTITGTTDRRDILAITRLASGFCKLLFPHGQLEADDFVAYCLRPAVQLRQRVRDQLSLLDPEYPRIRMNW